MRINQPLNRYIDHTLLAPAAMDVAFEGLLEEAVKNRFYSVCVSPYIALQAAQALRTFPDIKVCTVVSFPHGNVPLIFKLAEAEFLVKNGIQEIDWVLHYGEVLNENWAQVSEEMQKMADLCRQGNAVSKCIVETSITGNTRMATRLFQTVRDAGVDFIKTSTGFNGEGAKIETISLWNTLRGSDSKPFIKASGGIKTAEKALAMIEAGADRLGMSSSVDVMEQYYALQTSTEGGAKTEKVSGGY